MSLSERIELLDLLRLARKASVDDDPCRVEDLIEEAIKILEAHV